MRMRLITTNSSVRKKVLGTILIGGAGYLYLKVWLPLTGIGIPCVFHEVTGLYCPGCGITRSLGAILRLDIHEAFRYNMLIFILAPLYLLYMLAVKKDWVNLKNGLLYSMLGLTISFGILRNIPIFSWMEPTSFT
ncbi:DUF2752 domain-containing protein [Paenibacillus tundrae]|uniref:DUF2752 domain-containing protein n=1 Tax=Paenibacillus tundrae TaxID=528187 RepID=UPI0030D0FB8B